MIKIVPHCGSAFVKGKARKYRYFIASVFSIKKCKSGKFVWYNIGKHTYPRRSFKLCLDDAIELSNKYKELGLDTEVIMKYGSWHNKKV